MNEATRDARAEVERRLREEGEKNRTRPIIPAHPGFTLISAMPMPEHDHIFSRESLIIGWRLDEDGGVTPITIIEPAHPNHRFGVKYPDGRVEDSGFIYRDEVRWREMILEAEAERRERGNT